MGVIEEIVHLYHDARTPLYPHNKVERGESRSVFAQTEDLFACYFGETFSNELDKVLINQNLIFKKGVANRKPDITLIRGGEAKVFMDLKMDLGFKRNEFEISVKNTEEWLGSARNETFHYFAKETGREPIEAKVGQDAIWLYIVISDSNMGKNQIPANGVSTRTNGVETHVVLKGFHPNTYTVSKRFSEDFGPDLKPNETLGKKEVMDILRSRHKDGINHAFKTLRETISSALK